MNSSKNERMNESLQEQMTLTSNSELAAIETSQQCLTLMLSLM